MPKRKIIADSSANLLQLPGVDFAVAPLKILAGDREFVDDAALDTNAMVQWFDSYKGRSKTSCPNTADWLQCRLRGQGTVRVGASGQTGVRH